MARCGCGGAGATGCACSLTAGTNVTVTGAGTAGDPWVVNSSGGGGGPATITSGAGLLGDGSSGDPVRAATASWSFGGDLDTTASGIYTDSTGALRGEPGWHTYFVQSIQEAAIASLTVPSEVTTVRTFSFPMTNPDPSRNVRIVAYRDVEVDFDLPAGAGAGMGISGDEMWYVHNSGASASTDRHVQVSKLTVPSDSIAPGQAFTITLPITLARGSGGATYTRVAGTFRVMLLPV
jgi:hypothetical protein